MPYYFPKSFIDDLDQAKTTLYTLLSPEDKKKVDEKQSLLPSAELSTPEAKEDHLVRVYYTALDQLYKAIPSILDSNVPGPILEAVSELKKFKKAIKKRYLNKIGDEKKTEDEKITTYPPVVYGERSFKVATLANNFIQKLIGNGFADDKERPPKKRLGFTVKEDSILPALISYELAGIKAKDELDIVQHQMQHDLLNNIDKASFKKKREEIISQLTDEKDQKFLDHNDELKFVQLVELRDGLDPIEANQEIIRSLLENSQFETAKTIFMRSRPMLVPHIKNFKVFIDTFKRIESQFTDEYSKWYFSRLKQANEIDKLEQRIKALEDSFNAFEGTLKEKNQLTEEEIRQSMGLESVSEMKEEKASIVAPSPSSLPSSPSSPTSTSSSSSASPSETRVVQDSHESSQEDHKDEDPEIERKEIEIKSPERVREPIGLDIELFTEEEEKKQIQWQRDQKAIMEKDKKELSVLSKTLKDGISHARLHNKFLPLFKKCEGIHTRLTIAKLDRKLEDKIRKIPEMKTDGFFTSINEHDIRDAIQEFTTLESMIQDQIDYIDQDLQIQFQSREFKQFNSFIDYLKKDLKEHKENIGPTILDIDPTIIEGESELRRGSDYKHMSSAELKKHDENLSRIAQKLEESKSLIATALQAISQYKEGFDALKHVQQKSKNELIKGLSLSTIDQSISEYLSTIQRISAKHASITTQINQRITSVREKHEIEHKKELRFEEEEKQRVAQVAALAAAQAAAAAAAQAERERQIAEQKRPEQEIKNIKTIIETKDFKTHNFIWDNHKITVDGRSKVVSRSAYNAYKAIEDYEKKPPQQKTQEARIALLKTIKDEIAEKARVGQTDRYGCCRLWKRTQETAERYTEIMACITPLNLR